MAKKIAPELSRVGGGALIKNPDVFARAVALVSEAAPERLIETDAFWDALDGPGRRLLEELEDDEEMEEAMKIAVDF